MDRKEVCCKYIHWCDDCPKAYDLSCSGADMLKCSEDKKKFVNDYIYSEENISQTRTYKFCPKCSAKMQKEEEKK